MNTTTEVRFEVDGETVTGGKPGETWYAVYTVPSPLADGSLTEAQAEEYGQPRFERLVEVPADVRDNSETVTDYAFMRHRSPDKGNVGPDGRDYELTTVRNYLSHMYDVYSWSDVNQGDRRGYGAGQRCRFDMVVRKDTGAVSYLFHTEYFTRVVCVTHEHYYAQYYASITDQDGVTTAAQPYCDECIHRLRRSAAESGMMLNLSEHLLIGQHD